MYLPPLEYVFTLSIIIGFVIPIINIISGSFGDLLNLDLDIDAGIDLDLDLDLDADFDLDMDTGDTASGWLPFNVLCLCLLLVVFGVAGRTLGRWMTGLWATVGLTVAALALGLFFYWLMYKFVILKLKQGTVPTLSYDDLCGKSAEVTMTISGDSMGMISILDSTGTFLSFRAKRDPDLAGSMGDTIKKGQRVLITEVDKAEKLCYVSVPPGDFVDNSFK